MANHMKFLDQFAPGTLYEDVFHHPVLCIGVSIEDDEIWGISLIDGSQPRTCSLAHNAIRRISAEEAWELKQRHIQRNGNDGWWIVDQSD